MVEKTDNATISSPYHTPMFFYSFQTLARTVRLGHFHCALETSGSQLCRGMHRAHQAQQAYCTPTKHQTAVGQLSK